MTNRGFTMIELIVALGLLGLVCTLVYRVLVTNQRLYLAQTQRIDVAQNLRAAVTILSAELRELDARDGDIAGPLGATRLDIRAMRWLGFVCQTRVQAGAPGVVEVSVRRALFFGQRGVDPSDSVFIYYDRNPATWTEDGWVAGRTVAVISGQCLDGHAATRLTIALDDTRSPDLAAAIPVGAPVRGFERATYRLYQPAGDTAWYVGVQTPGSSIQPFAGPVMDRGLTFSYFDSAGVATLDPHQVARIDLTVRARGALTRASVALRGNRRF
jgi:prepilin-type N-terminal cleavage/methylation domain-containing protein